MKESPSISKTDLAIVVPCYKIDFFEKALQSILQQTNHSFNLYIINDGSPYDFKSILEKYEPGFEIFYHKFEVNIGNEDLTASWTRAIEFVEEEKWIWLFSDDDEMAGDCVEQFYLQLSTTQSSYDLYRFNNVIIDEKGNIKSKISSHPAVESSENFLRRRLHYETHSYVSEYIFRKSRYLECNGFVSFPAAWASDDATWVKLGLQNGICTVPSALVKWRLSSQNVTGSRTNASKNKQKKIATIQFVNWAYLLAKKNNFNIQITEFLEWHYTMMKLIGYQKNIPAYATSLAQLKTLNPFSFILHAKFLLRWLFKND